MQILKPKHIRLDPTAPALCGQPGDVLTAAAINQLMLNTPGYLCPECCDRWGGWRPVQLKLIDDE